MTDLDKDEGLLLPHCSVGKAIFSVWLQTVPSFIEPISQPCSSIIICWQKSEVTSSHPCICGQDGLTDGRRSEMIQGPAQGRRETQQLQTHICLSLCVCVCVCNLAVICLIIPFRSMDFDGENMAFYFWAYLNYTLVTLVITELFTKFLCFGLRGRYLKNW